MSSHPLMEGIIRNMAFADWPTSRIETMRSSLTLKAIDREDFYAALKQMQEAHAGGDFAAVTAVVESVITRALTVDEEVSD